MRLKTTCRMALVSLGTHPFRAMLAGLGVVFGVGAVIAMLAIGEGARREAMKQISSLGVDKIIVRSMRPAGEGMLETAFYGLTENDLIHIQTQFENIRLAVPMRMMNQPVFAQEAKSDIRVVGTTEAFFDLLNITRENVTGRLLSPVDLSRRSPVCVVGAVAANTLFPRSSILAKAVQVRHQNFTAIGNIHHPDDFSFAEGYTVNNTIFLPLTTANDVFGQMTPRMPGWWAQDTRIEIDLMILAITDIDQIENTAERLRAYLARSHLEADYQIEIPLMLLRQKEQTQRIFSIVMGSIAGISLLVGGIGIMNIMLANIYERMREIGTRLALGAKRRDILLQFLLESVLLTSFGGCLGILVGSGLALTIEHYAGMPVGFTPSATIISFGVSVLTGIAFGTAPAWKAARLHPIEALRSE